MIKNLKIIYFGNNKTYLQFLQKNEIVLAVFCNPDLNDRDIWISELKKFAFEHDIPLFQPQKINCPENIEIIKKNHPDLIVVGGYKFIIPEEIFSIPRLGTINIHPSYLPKYRGQHVINWALINGESETGITIHFMDKGIDTGNIIKQKIVPISIDDTSKTLSDRLFKAGVNILEEVLYDFKRNHISRIKQNEALSTYFRSRKEDDGIIDWNKSAYEIYNLIRALVKPWPGAITNYDRKKIIIWNSTFNNVQKYGYIPGEIINIKDNAMEVATKNGTLIVKQAEYNGNQIKEFEDVFKAGGKFH